jgi:hypothetical protein
VRKPSGAIKYEPFNKTGNIGKRTKINKIKSQHSKLKTMTSEDTKNKNDEQRGHKE